MAKLTANQEEIAKAWLHDLFVWGGLIPSSIRPNSNYYYMYGRYNTGNIEGKKAAKILCDAIKYRKISKYDFEEYDQKLNTISNFAFDKNLMSQYTDRHNIVRKSAAELAKYIAAFCKNNTILWKTSNVSKEELEAIVQNSILGKALWEFKCFASQQKETKAEPKGTSTPRQPGQAPQNGYKSTGPHSADIPNLLGNAGDKVILTGKLLCIEADKIGANTPKAFITPIKTNASGVIQISKAEAEKVNFGSGQGYTDCKLWFDNNTSATDFMNACINKFGNKFTNIHLAYKSADPNGYFYVSTEFGNAYIKASVLNEQLKKHAAKEKQTEKLKVDFDIYEEAYYKEY